MKGKKLSWDDMWTAWAAANPEDSKPSPNKLSHIALSTGVVT